MALVAAAEVVDDVLRPLVRFGQEDAVGEPRVDFLAHPLQVLVGLRQVLAIRAVVLEEIGDRVEPEAVEPEARARTTAP